MTEGTTASKHEFHQKLVLLIVDKLVFGLLIGVAAFALNIVLENYRSGHETRAEIARLRVDHVAQVALALDKQQRAINGLYVPDMWAVARTDKEVVSYLNGTYKSAWAGEGTAKLAWAGEGTAKLAKARQGSIEVHARQAAVRALLVANRFWIGERAYPRYLSVETKEEALRSAYNELFDDEIADDKLFVEHDWRAIKSASWDVSKLKPSERPAFRRAHQRYLSTLVKIGRIRADLRRERLDVFGVMSDLS